MSSHRPSLEKTVYSFCQDQQLLQASDSVVVGVSGGPDSMALLYILNSFRTSLGIKLTVAHLHHGLRPQALAEQRYVRSVAYRLGLPFVTKRITSLCSQKSLEATARDRRLRFLFRVAQQTHTHIIALGHHQKDLAETVLMRLMRGTGLDGIRSILPVREFGAFTLIRPLLNTSREDILQFLKDNKIKFFHDRSNENTTFLRNRIRHKLLPLLEKDYNPQTIQHLASYSQQMDSAYDCIHQESLKALRRHTRPLPHAQGYAFDQDALRLLPQAILTECLRLSIEKFLGHTRRVTSRHLDQAVRLIYSQAAQATIHLPCQLVLVKKDHRLSLQRRSTPQSRKAPTTS